MAAPDRRARHRRARHHGALETRQAFVVERLERHPAAQLARSHATPPIGLPLAIQPAKMGSAAAALYGIARLQALTLGKTDDALRSIDAYVRRFPRGAEIEDALWLRLRIECRTQTSEPCRVAAHSYLRAAPSGSAKAELATRVTRRAP